MKTNSKYDLSAIMGRAWAIRKAAAAECGCKVSEVVWSLCLRQAWSEASVSVATRRTISEWATMADEDKISMIKRCVYKAAARRDYDVWGRGHEINEYVNEAWLRLYKSLDYDNLLATNEGRVAEWLKPISLITVVYQAASISIDTVGYADRKHSVADSYLITDSEGNDIDYLATLPGAADTERAAEILVALKRYRDGLDERGRKVLSRLVHGYTEREIASEVGVSGPAIHKRIAKIRRDLAFLLG